MTIARRSRYVPTAGLRPGVILPPRHTWDMSAPGQEVIEVKTQSIRLRDLATDELYETRLHSRGVACPELRPEVIDWRTQPRPPKAHEVQEGDILDFRNEATRGTVLAKPQKCMGVSLNHLGMLQLYFHDSEAAFRPTYHLDEEVIFPVDMTEFRRRRRTEPIRQLNPVDRGISRANAIATAEVVGYYRHKQTGQVFAFLRHPFGRGMWPKEIPGYDSEKVTADGSPFRCRPPRNGFSDLLRELDKVTGQELDELVVKYDCPAPGVPANQHYDEGLIASEVASGDRPPPPPLTIPPGYEVPLPKEDPVERARREQEAARGEGPAAPRPL